MCLDFCWKKKKFEPTYVSSRDKHRLSSMKKGSIFRKGSGKPVASQRYSKNHSSEADQLLKKVSLGKLGNGLFHRIPPKGSVDKDSFSDISSTVLPKKAVHRDRVSDTMPPPKTAQHRDRVTPQHRECVSDNNLARNRDYSSDSILPSTVAQHKDNNFIRARHHSLRPPSTAARHQDHDPVSDFTPPPPKVARHQSHINSPSTAARHQDHVSDFTPPPPKAARHQNRIDSSHPPSTAARHRDHDHASKFTPPPPKATRHQNRINSSHSSSTAARHQHRDHASDVTPPPQKGHINSSPPSSIAAQHQDHDRANNFTPTPPIKAARHQNHTDPPSIAAQHRDHVSDFIPQPLQTAQHQNQNTHLLSTVAQHQDHVSDLTPPPPKTAREQQNHTRPPPTVGQHQKHISDPLPPKKFNHVNDDLPLQSNNQDRVNNASPRPKGHILQKHISDNMLIPSPIPPPPPRRSSSLKQKSVSKAPLSTIQSTPVIDQEMRLSTGQLQPKDIKGLTQWYNIHGGNSYPTPIEKRALAKQLGLSVEQVSLWFSNLRNSTRNNQSNVKKVLII